MGKETLLPQIKETGQEQINRLTANFENEFIKLPLDSVKRLAIQDAVACAEAEADVDSIKHGNQPHEQKMEALAVAGPRLTVREETKRLRTQSPSNFPDYDLYYVTMCSYVNKYANLIFPHLLRVEDVGKDKEFQYYSAVAKQTVCSEISKIIQFYNSFANYNARVQPVE
jgi:hypothetical protein